jgi:HD-GYP domain-containing protein (c-di-GMP phosphodiesterase class II)
MITEPTVFDSQILCLADSIERRIARDTYILHQHSRIQDKARAMAGTEVHGDIVDLFMNASEREEFWLDLTAPRLYSLLLHNGPFCRLDIDLSRIATIARLFKNLIDFKSPYTATHSSGVAESAVCLTRLVGLTELETQLMEVAGYLHDIGKLVVPNAILEKPGKLSRDEFAVIKQHTYVTFSVLSTIPGMLEIAEWAAYHHEKFDGTGYPFRRTAKELNIGARIMAVADIFTALAEDRPYREGMDAAAIQRILQDEAATGRLDKRIVAVLLENIDSIQVVVRRKQEEAREHYAQKVVRGSL